MSWVVEVQVLVARGSLERGTLPTFAWSTDDQLPANGTFETAPAAMRAALAWSSGSPDWLAVSDGRVRWEWRRPYNHARRRRLRRRAR